MVSLTSPRSASYAPERPVIVATPVFTARLAAVFFANGLLVTFRCPAQGTAVIEGPAITAVSVATGGVIVVLGKVGRNVQTG